MKLDNDLVQIYREEARDLLTDISIAFKKWLSSPKDKEFLSPILRNIHTLKGSSRMIGLHALTEYIIILEQLFKNIEQSEQLPSQEQIDEMQNAIDYINFYIDSYNYAISKFPDDDKIPIEKIKKIEISDVVREDEKEREYFSDNIKIGEAPVDYVRVESKQLQEFSLLAGQISSSRAHIEQQIKRLNQDLSDIMKQAKSAQDQIRHMQMKADANIYEIENYVKKPQNEEFDILELDRYSFFQEMTRTLSEGAHHIQSLAVNSLNSLKNSEFTLTQQKRSTRVLEEKILHSRLITMEKIIPRLERLTRQLSQELGKDVHFECVRVEGEIDRNILERLIPSFEHMIRNAIDHGIGRPDERTASHKSTYGVIRLSLYRQGGEIVIHFADDGKGINLEKVEQRAIEKNLWDPNVRMTLSDAYQIILLPGFSSKDALSAISGQGIGLDVVNSEINRLGGVLRIDSKPGKGTEFIIRIPFALSLSQILVFELDKQLYGLGLTQISGVKKYLKSELLDLMKSSNKIQYQNLFYDYFSLNDLFIGTDNIPTNSFMPSSIIFLQCDNSRIALEVDKLIGSWEAAIQPLSHQLQFIDILSGVSLLNEEKIVLILDSSSLVDYLHKKEDKNLFNENNPIKKTILIVDDSVTVRQVTSRLLERYQFHCVSAKEGKEALVYMEDHVPDIILLDLEMPEMDGFELLQEIRKDPRLMAIPVIVITSRSGEKHRTHAKNMGVSGYFTKPYLEEHLIQLIRSLLNE